jgi:hypothetical protein
LLPIREAYEWKHGILIVHGKDRKILASNSWSVWMETLSMLGTYNDCKVLLFLLPIREAYEWKLGKKRSGCGL